MRADAVRAVRWFVAFAASTLLAACSTMLDMAGVERAGHQSDGTYVVSAEEEGLACRQIHARLESLDRQIQAIPDRVLQEEQSRPRTVGAALGRMFGGPGAGLKAVNDHKKASAERAALSALYERKECA